jgi:uncharacterized protein (UPF0332 family)
VDWHGEFYDIQRPSIGVRYDGSMTDAEVFLAKAEESLLGAESEFANGRYDNCVNRCYYACFQAAIAALIRASIRPAAGHQWSHMFVQAQFSGQLVSRRKRFPADVRDTLSVLIEARLVADYRRDRITKIQADRALRRTRAFLTATTPEDRTT